MINVLTEVDGVKFETFVWKLQDHEAKRVDKG